MPLFNDVLRRPTHARCVPQCSNVNTQQVRPLCTQTHCKHFRPHGTCGGTASAVCERASTANAAAAAACLQTIKYVRLPHQHGHSHFHVRTTHQHIRTHLTMRNVCAVCMQCVDTFTTTDFFIPPPLRLQYCELRVYASSHAHTVHTTTPTSRLCTQIINIVADVPHQHFCDFPARRMCRIITAGACMRKEFARALASTRVNANALQYLYITMHTDSTLDTRV